MQERHLNREQYFQEQIITTRNHVIPYINKHLTIGEGTHVLEIGCGEGGNLVPFLDLNCTVVGIDISENKINLAGKFLENHPNKKNLRLILENIYKADYLENIFDLIVMRDVIEHIPQQEIFMLYVKRFLKKGGKIFFGFPPWQNPFGGHQQIINHRTLSKIPWLHLLPSPFYKFILKGSGVQHPVITGLMEIKKTGISIERFEKILRKTDSELLTPSSLN